ncbi:hypothetical protein SAURM35S_00046 [Streptomyces aurantiogriseus]
MTRPISRATMRALTLLALAATSIALAYATRH